MDFKELQTMIASAEGAANDLAKSLSADPAASTAGAAAAAAAAAGGAAAASAGALNPEDDALTKSFSITLDDGSVMEAVDATAMLKSFGERLTAEKGERTADTEQFMKAFGSVIGIVNTVTSKLDATNQALVEANKQIADLKTQNEAFSKSLNEFGGQGRGRRSADVTVIARQAAEASAAGAAAEPTRAEVMAKSLEALSNNRIDGLEASRIEAAINAGRMPEKALLDRLFKQ